MNRKLLIFDDDPTGTQTVHGLQVLLDYGYASLVSFFDSGEKAAFVLTNTRAMTPEKTEELNRQIASDIERISKQKGIAYSIFIRGDSTLRGHFPNEMKTVAKAAGNEADAYILMPFFKEGGRVTIGDKHYVRSPEGDVEVSKTEFANDFAFGFKSSDLKEYVEEKTNGTVKSEDVVSITLSDLRECGASRALEKLSSLSGGAFCIVNAEEYSDAQAFAGVFHKVEDLGKRLYIRCAASFVKAYLAIKDKPALTGSQLGISKERGGVLIVGSYVPKTTKQLEALLSQREMRTIELSVSELCPENVHYLSKKIAAEIDLNIAAGCDTVLFTSRKLRLEHGEEESLNFGNLVSECLSGVVNTLGETPAFVLAKGGITSSDVAAKGLEMRGAMVLGQIIPGVSVWMADGKSRFPNSPYIVFPGNVGDSGALLEAFSRLRSI